MMNQIATATDHNLTTTTMGIDQTAAFDCVDPTILQDKLPLYGLEHKTTSWLKSYLANRSFYVVIGSTKSKIHSTYYGVPQGSILGPLLYLIYINEFPAAMEDDFCVDLVHRSEEILFGNECEDCGNLIVFADDSLYQYASNNRTLNQERIRNKFLKIKDFLNYNGLQINEGKTFLTEYMTKQKHARLRGVPPELTIEVKVEDKVNKGRFVLEEKTISDSWYSRTLGLNMQNNLSWEAHLTTGSKAVLPSARKQLGRLYRLQDSLSPRVKLLLVNSLVISKLTYGISLWGHGTSNHLRRAQILLNQAGRFITGMGRTARSSDIMTKCSWLNIRELAIYHTLLQFFKTVRWGSPSPMRQRVKIDDDNLISTERPRLLLTKGSYRAQSASLWNSLPGTLRTETSVSQFKILVKRWIIERRDSETDMDPDLDPDLVPDPNPDTNLDPDLDPNPLPVHQPALLILMPLPPPPPPPSWTTMRNVTDGKF